MGTPAPEPGGTSTSGGTAVSRLAPSGFHRRGRDSPDFFSSARSFPTEMGGNIEADKVRGYYFDLRFRRKPRPGRRAG
jgi:hypothetical protein